MLCYHVVICYSDLADLTLIIAGEVELVPVRINSITRNVLILMFGGAD